MKSRWRYRGMTVLEVTISLFVLGVAMAALLQIVALAGRQRRGAEQRRMATQEVANQAERIALLPWDDTAAGKLTAWQPSAELQQVLPAAECRIAVSDESGSPPARRIRLEIGWTNAVQQPVEPVTLTVWRFAAEGSP